MSGDGFRNGSGDFSFGSEVWPGLAKLAEECGETQQVCGKIVGFRGGRHHWDGSDLRARLEEEMGDLLAAITFVAEMNGLDEGAIKARAQKKHTLFEQWHRDQTVSKTDSAPPSIEGTTDAPHRP